MIIIDGDQRDAVIAEHTLHRAIGGSLDGLGQFFGSGRAARHKHQVDQRHIWRWNANGSAVQLADQLRQNQANSLGSTG